MGALWRVNPSLILNTMLDLTDHFLRKAYSLSLNEYAVLLEIYWLSHNSKYGGWCVASKEYIGETLDLKRDCVFNAIKKLIDLELVEKEPELKKLRTTDKFNSVLAERRNFAMSIKTREEEIQILAQPKLANFDAPSEKPTVTVGKTDDPTVGKTDATIITSSKYVNDTTTGVGKILIRYISSFPDIRSPKGMASDILKKFPEKTIKQALKSANCTGPGQLYQLCEQIKNPPSQLSIPKLPDEGEFITPEKAKQIRSLTK